MFPAQGKTQLAKVQGLESACHHEQDEVSGRQQQCTGSTWECRAVQTNILIIAGSELTQLLGAHADAVCNHGIH